MYGAYYYLVYRAFPRDVTNHVTRVLMYRLVCMMQLVYCSAIYSSPSVRYKSRLQSTFYKCLCSIGGGIPWPWFCVLYQVAQSVLGATKCLSTKYQRLWVVEEHLNKWSRAGHLAAIRIEGLTDKIISNDRVCSRHFVTGKPASLEDDMHPDWLPTQHLSVNPHQQMSCNLMCLVLRLALTGMKEWRGNRNRRTWEPLSITTLKNKVRRPRALLQ